VSLKDFGDTTYVPLRAVVGLILRRLKDKFTRRIVGWAMELGMTADLVVKALQRALRSGLIKLGAIMHTDRGSQNVSNDCRRVLANCGHCQSIPGKGNCYDNAQAESFFSRFKTELIEGSVFTSLPGSFQN